MRRTISCCYDCPDRILHCHSTCEKYLTEQKEYQEAKDAVMKQHGMDFVADKAIRQGNERRSRIRKRKK